MSASGPDDLSGRWKGFFNYPDGFETTEFDAELRDLGGAISGETSEPHFEDSGRILYATLQGARVGSNLRFHKTYDELDLHYHMVVYEGRIDPSGDEISGEWTVPGIWSGTFLMIRASGRAEGIERRVEEIVR